MPRPDLFDDDRVRGLLQDPRSPFLGRDLRELRARLVRAEAAALMALMRHAVGRGVKRMAGRPAPRAVST